MTTKSKSPGKPKLAKPSKEPVPGKKAPGTRPARPSSRAANQRPSPRVKPTKTQQCLDLLTASDGATIDELKAATGWQAHSVRGFLSGTVKKKFGLTLDSTKVEDGARHYRVIAAETGS